MESGGSKNGAGQSNLLAFPAAAFEKDDARSSDGGLRDDDGPKDAAGTHAQGNGEKIGEGYLQQPETEEMHDGRRDGVSRAVEGLEHDHAIGIADVAVAENAQAGDGQWDDERIAGEETDDRFGEDDEEHADDAEENHVVKAGAPDGSFRALGLLGTEVLADEGGGGVAEAPTRHQHEDKYANGDGIAGERRRAEDTDDAHEADPTGVGDGKLQDSSERDAQEAKHGERPPAEDEARVEHEVDDVGDPQQTHGDGGVTRATEDGVVEKEHHDGAAATEGDASVAGADGNDLRRGAHQTKQIRSVEETRNADDGRGREANDDGLDACNGGAGGILFADTARDHGGGGKALAEANSENKTEKR